MTSILVVEDEPGISSFVAKGLTSAGYNVTVVDKGAEAISGALGGDYSLIVLDIGLPDMDGFEVLEQIRGQGATLPIIVLTARSSVEDTVSGLEQGADDYMAKPFRFEELLARIRLRLRTAISDDPSNMVQINVGGLHLDLRTRCATIDGGTSGAISARVHYATSLHGTPRPGSFSFPAARYGLGIRF